MAKVRRISSDPIMDKLMDLLEKIPEKQGSRYLKALKAVTKRIDQKADPIASGKIKGVKWKGSFDK
jgi:hypothetical protein